MYTNRRRSSGSRVPRNSRSVSLRRSGGYDGSRNGPLSLVPPYNANAAVSSEQRLAALMRNGAAQGTTAIPLFAGSADAAALIVYGLTRAANTPEENAGLTQYVDSVIDTLPPAALAAILTTAYGRSNKPDAVFEWQFDARSWLNRAQRFLWTRPMGQQWLTWADLYRAILTGNEQYPQYRTLFLVGPTRGLILVQSTERAARLDSSLTAEFFFDILSQKPELTRSNTLVNLILDQLDQQPPLTRQFSRIQLDYLLRTAIATCNAMFLQQLTSRGYVAVLTLDDLNDMVPLFAPRVSAQLPSISVRLLRHVTQQGYRGVDAAAACITLESAVSLYAEWQFARARAGHPAGMRDDRPMPA